VASSAAALNNELQQEEVDSLAAVVHLKHLQLEEADYLVNHKNPILKL